MVIFHSYISLPEGTVIQTNITNYSAAALYLFDRIEAHEPAANSIQSLFFFWWHPQNQNHQPLLYIFGIFYKKNNQEVLPLHEVCLS